jgi:hypothetical protein
MMKATVKSIAAESGGTYRFEVSIETDNGKPIEVLAVTGVTTKDEALAKVNARLEELKQRETVAQWASELVGTTIATI